MDSKSNIRIFKPFIKNKNYLVSNFGEILVLNHRHKSKINKFLKPRLGGSNKQYLRYSIKNKDYYAHRLVLEHFLGKCPKGMECAHLDGNPKNNHISNLAWVTPKENSQHKILHGTSGKGSKNSQSKINEKDVKVIRNMYSLGVHQKVIAMLFNVKNITPIALSRSWKHVENKNLYKNKLIAKEWIKTSNERKDTSTKHISCCG